MSVYLYDGSFEGFLTLVYHSFYQRESVSRIIKDKNSVSLLDEVIEIVTDGLYAKKVHDGLRKKFDRKNYNRIFNTFLCDSRDFEKALYDFMVIGFKDQKKLADINHPSIYYLEKLEREYFRYLDKMYGFVRFKELEDKTLYANIDGKFNILPYLGNHFKKRLSSMDFIIHDTQRELAYIDGIIHKVADFDLPLLSDDEEKFQKLWKLFFKNVTIKKRENLKLQQNFVPLLYRKYMIEFS